MRILACLEICGLPLLHKHAVPFPRSLCSHVAANGLGCTHLSCHHFGLLTDFSAFAKPPLNYHTAGCLAASYVSSLVSLLSRA